LYRLLGAKIPVGLTSRNLGVYCNEPWLHQNAKLIDLFGGASDSDYNVPLSGLVVVMVVCMIGYFTLLI